MKKIIPLILTLLIIIVSVFAVLVFVPQLKEAQKIEDDRRAAVEAAVEEAKLAASSERRPCPVRRGSCRVTLRSAKDRSGELKIPILHDLYLRREDNRIPMTIRLQKYDSTWVLIHFPRGGGYPKEYPNGLLPGSQKVEFLAPNLKKGEVLVINVSYTKM